MRAVDKARGLVEDELLEHFISMRGLCSCGARLPDRAPQTVASHDAHHIVERLIREGLIRDE